MRIHYVMNRGGVFSCDVETFEIGMTVLDVLSAFDDAIHGQSVFQASKSIERQSSNERFDFYVDDDMEVLRRSKTERWEPLEESASLADSHADSHADSLADSLADSFADSFAEICELAKDKLLMETVPGRSFIELEDDTEPNIPDPVSLPSTTKPLEPSSLSTPRDISFSGEPILIWDPDFVEDQSRVGGLVEDLIEELSVIGDSSFSEIMICSRCSRLGVDFQCRKCKTNID